MKQDQRREHRVPSTHEKDRATELVPDERIELSAGCRRGETKLEFPVGEPDLEALRSVTREWLVPLLVEKFLREQGVELRARANTGCGKTPISDLWVKEVTDSHADHI
jgi:hypothetical protein